MKTAKPRTSIPRISAKRAAKFPLLVKIGRTILPANVVPPNRLAVLVARQSQPVRHVTPRARNPQNQPKNFARCFHSIARVIHVKSQPCAACGVEGFSVNAHLLGNDGAHRRGPYDSIGPLCDDRFGIVGCHTLYDLFRWVFVERFPTFDAVAVAALTELGWQESAEVMAGAR